MWSRDIVSPNCAPAVGLFDVVEYFEDDVGFLTEVNATLQPDGLVFITVPAFKCLWSFGDDYAGHFRRYRVSQLRRLLESTGFRVEYCTYFFLPLVLPNFSSTNVALIARYPQDREVGNYRPGAFSANRNYRTNC